MTLHDRLRAVVGEAGLLTEPGRLAGYLTDWRGAHRGRAAAVVRPATTDEVAAVVRLCHDEGAAVVPQGGNTGLCGGAVPDDSGTQLTVLRRAGAELDRVETGVAHLTLPTQCGRTRETLRCCQVGGPPAPQGHSPHRMGTQGRYTGPAPRRWCCRPPNQRSPGPSPVRPDRPDRPTMDVPDWPGPP